MNDHSWVHLQIVLNRALHLFRLLHRAGLKSSIETDYSMSHKDAEVVIAGGCLLHDLGMSIHRIDHEAFSLFLAADLLDELLEKVYEEPERTVIACRDPARDHRPSQGRAPADARGRRRARRRRARHGARPLARVLRDQPAEHPLAVARPRSTRSGSSRASSARSASRSLMNNSAGVFQVDELMATKLRGSGLETARRGRRAHRRRAREAAPARLPDLGRSHADFPVVCESGIRETRALRCPAHCSSRVAALLFAAPAAQAACPDQPLSRAVHARGWTSRGTTARLTGSFDGAWCRRRGTLVGASVADGALSIPAGATAVTARSASRSLTRPCASSRRGTGVLATSVISDRPRAADRVAAGVGNFWAPSPIQLIVLNLLGEARRPVPLHQRARDGRHRRRLDRPLQQGLNPQREQREVVARRGLGATRARGARRSPRASSRARARDRGVELLRRHHVRRRATSVSPSV